ncbi:MAG: hypothetical protein AAB588_05365 [Patescibacteria group bacterium]
MAEELDKNKKLGEKGKEQGPANLGGERTALLGDVHAMDADEARRVSLTVNDLVRVCPPKKNLQIDYGGEMPDGADDATPLETIADMYSVQLGEALHIDTRERLGYELKIAQERVKLAPQLRTRLAQAHRLRPKLTEINTVDANSLRQGIAKLAQFSKALDGIEEEADDLVAADGSVALVELHADDLLKIKERDVNKVIAEMVQAGFECGKGPLSIDTIVTNVIKHERLTNPAAQRQTRAFGADAAYMAPSLFDRSYVRRQNDVPQEDLDSLLEAYHKAYFTTGARYENLQFRLDKNYGMKAYNQYILQLQDELKKQNPSLVTNAPKAKNPNAKAAPAQTAEGAGEEARGEKIIAKVQELVNACPPRDGLKIPYKKNAKDADGESPPEIIQMVRGYEAELRDALDITDKERLAYEITKARERLQEGFELHGRIQAEFKDYPPSINETSLESVQAGIAQLKKMEGVVASIYHDLTGLVDKSGDVVKVTLQPEDLLDMKQSAVQTVIDKMVAAGFQCGTGPYTIDTIVKNVIEHQRLTVPPQRTMGFNNYGYRGIDLDFDTRRRPPEKEPPTLENLLAEYKKKETHMRENYLPDIEDDVTRTLGAYALYVQGLEDQLK